MKTLGANAIRVYHVDASSDHSACMNAFAAAGIYAFIDLDTFDTQINQVRSLRCMLNNLKANFPVQASPEWNNTQLKAFEAVMDSFQGFDNVAGFFIGNEVLTTPDGSPAAPYVKAAASDLKAYRDSKGYRPIPVGYSAADIASLRPMLQNYLACGSDPNMVIDFFSLNAYEWCGDSSYQQSGYAQLTANITTYSIPIFFSETGCNTVPPRTFTDQAAIFGPQMAPYWSGSIIYEWIEEANNYGLISYGAQVDPSSPNAPPDGYPRAGNPAPVEPDFDNLKGQWASAIPSSVSLAAYTPSNSAPACPAQTPGVWDVDPNASLPTLLTPSKGNTNSNSGNTTNGGSGGGKNGTKNSASATTVTAQVAAITASVQTGAIAVAMAFGSRSAVPLILLSLLCWATIGNVMML
jgi:1,3-beta-glucanosyltransferase GAS1